MISPRFRIGAAAAFGTLVLLATSLSLATESNRPLETIEVKGPRAEVREQVDAFVTAIRRKKGRLIGPWCRRVCPMIVGVSDEQTAFI